VLRAGCAALVITWAGCALKAASPADPAASLRVLADALSRSDPHQLWSKLSASARARTSEAELAAAWAACAAERAQSAGRIRAAAGGQVVLRAEIEAAGQVMPLAWEDRRWRVASARPSARGAPTPEEALRRFTAALEAHDLDGVLRLLGEPLRSLVERELAERLTGLKAAAGQPVAVDGDHAQIRYDTHHHLDLRRENGQWQVVDFN